MMSYQHYDVIIAGAGPAGLTLARVLAREKVKLALLELKSSFKRGSRYVLVPREIIPSSLEAVPCQAYYVNTLREIRPVPTHIPYSFVETAALLGHWARELEPPPLFSHRLSEIKQEGEGLALRVEGTGGGRRLTCQILAACDGSYSLSNRVFSNGPCYVRGMEYLFRGVSCEGGVLESFHTHKYSPGLYAWIFQLGDGKAVTGLGTTAANPRRLLDRFVKEHPRCRALGLDLRKVVRRGAGLLSTGRGRLLMGRVIFTGDAAAGYPWLGGMTYPGAIKAAELAAQAISKALETGDLAHLKEYETAWEETFGQAFAYEARARAAFSQLNDEEVDAAYASRPTESLRRVVLKLAEEK